jgi:hypothetical protein
MLPIAHVDACIWMLKMTWLREVTCSVDNAGDALLSDPRVAAVHSTCQALTPTSTCPVLC